MTMQQPTTVGGTRYPQIQFLTDNPATNSRCNPAHPAGCVVPPMQAPGHFYPYYTLAKVNGACVWEFGQMTNGNTFGKDKQYGKFTDGLGPAERTRPDHAQPGLLTPLTSPPAAAGASMGELGGRCAQGAGSKAIGVGSYRHGGLPHSQQSQLG